MTRNEKIALTILKPINPTLIIVLGVYTVLWGLWLISPFWDVLTTASLYQAMEALAPESFWGAVAIASGALIMRGALKPSAENLEIGALTGFFHWFIIGIMYLVGDWMNTGGITALTFAIYCGIVWVNIKVNRDYFGKNAK